jgi:hypothetical protein
VEKKFSLLIEILIGVLSLAAKKLKTLFILKNVKILTAIKMPSKHLPKVPI